MLWSSCLTQAHPPMCQIRYAAPVGYPFCRSAHNQPTALCQSGNTLLIWAVRKNKEKLVGRLVRNGASVLHKNQVRVAAVLGALSVSLMIGPYVVRVDTSTASQRLTSPQSWVLILLCKP